MFLIPEPIPVLAGLVGLYIDIIFWIVVCFIFWSGYRLFCLFFSGDNGGKFAFLGVSLDFCFLRNESVSAMVLAYSLRGY